MAPLSAPGTDRARAILAGTVILLLLPFPFVFMRFWSRRLTKSRLAINDYLIILALLFTTGFNINIMLASINGGYGQHIKNVTMSELLENEKATIVSTVLWPTANMFVKLSILHFYQVIFSVNKKTLAASWVLVGLTVAYWLGTIITAFALCRPFAYNWNKTIEGHCGNTLVYYLSTAIINLLIDVFIVVLPQPVVWRLQMRLSRKISLAAIFGLGAIICAISIVRCWSIANLDVSDVTYNVVLDNVTTTLEPVLGIVNACLPIMQPVAARVGKSTVVSSARSLLRSSRSTTQQSGASGSNQRSSGNGSNFNPGSKAKPDPYQLKDITMTTSLHQEEEYIRDDSYGTGHDGSKDSSVSV